MPVRLLAVGHHDEQISGSTNTPARPTLAVDATEPSGGPSS
ncbi:hypothetical protein ACWCXB_14355 [Streptomyces sp. NPDC001514]